MKPNFEGGWRGKSLLRIEKLCFFSAPFQEPFSWYTYTAVEKYPTVIYTLISFLTHSHFLLQGVCFSFPDSTRCHEGLCKRRSGFSYQVSYQLGSALLILCEGLLARQTCMCWWGRQLNSEPCSPIVRQQLVLAITTRWIARFARPTASLIFVILFTLFRCCLQLHLISPI